jgi:putative addiction module component (TIGR02574 family)
VTNAIQHGGAGPDETVMVRVESTMERRAAVPGQGHLPPSLLRLSVGIEDAEDLWDDLASKPCDVPIHDWQKEELARRKANLMKHPESALSWDEVKQKFRP